jgi:hypothetical protein
MLKSRVDILKLVELYCTYRRDERMVLREVLRED